MMATESLTRTGERPWMTLSHPRGGKYLVSLGPAPEVGTRFVVAEDPSAVEALKKASEVLHELSQLCTERAMQLLKGER